MAITDYLLLENGSQLLLESGAYLLLESGPVTSASDVFGGPSITVGLADAERVVKGVGRVCLGQVNQVDGITPSGAYLSSDTLACRVWVGDSEGTLLTPTAAWTAAGAPYFSITFPAGSTTSMTVGLYAMQVIVTRSSTGATACIWDGQVEILPAPGSAAAPAVYIQQSDLETEIPNISDYLQRYRDSTGFLAQRAKARDWLDELCHRNCRGMAGLSSLVYPAEWPYRFLIKSPQLSGYLANNYLWLTQPLIDSQVYYTLHLVFRGLIPSNPKLYAEMSNEFKVRAELALRGCTAQVMGPQGDGSGAASGSGVLLAMIDFSSGKMVRG